jgi:hypothetical protein
MILNIRRIGWSKSQVRIRGTNRQQEALDAREARRKQRQIEMEKARDANRKTDTEKGGQSRDLKALR